MAAIDLDSLYKKYEGFHHPRTKVLLGGNNPEEDKKLKIAVSDILVEITS